MQNKYKTTLYFLGFALSSIASNAASTIIAFDDIYPLLSSGGAGNLRALPADYYAGQGLTFDYTQSIVDGSGDSNQSQALYGSNGNYYSVIRPANGGPTFSWGLGLSSAVQSIQFDLGLAYSMTADFTVTAYLLGGQVSQQVFNHGDTSPIGGSWRTVSFSGFDFDAIKVTAANGTGPIIPGFPIQLTFASNGSYGIDNIQVIPEPSAAFLSAFTLICIAGRRRRSTHK